MSQRTRARTTGAAPRHTKSVATDEPVMAKTPAKRSRRKTIEDDVAPAEEKRVEEPVEPGVVGMSPDALARALRAVAAELERDPALARRVASAMGGDVDGEREMRSASPDSGKVMESVMVEEPVATIGRTFRPSIVTGVTPDLGAGVPDPFALRDRLGLEGLREALGSLRLGSLRAIVREYKLDPSGHLSKLNDAAKLRERIVQVAKKRE